MGPPAIQAKAIAPAAAAPQPTLIRPQISDFTPLFWANRRLDPAQVRWVLQNAAMGSLQDQYELFALMEDTWPRLMKNLNEVRRPAANASFSVQPYAERGEKATDSAKEKADLVDAALKNWAPRPGTLEFGFEDTLYHALDAYGKGLSVLEISWQQGEEGILPRCGHLLSPRRYGWNKDGSELGLLTGAAEQISSPRSLLTDFGWAPFPTGQFWCGIWHARSGAPGATAMLRALAPYWVGITFGWEWLMANAQIFGVPFRWATYDANRPELLGTITQMLQQMGTAGYAAFPQGTTLEFKDAAQHAGDNPQVFIQTVADKYCDLLILGQEASGSTHSSGLGGAGQAQLQGEVRREVLHAAVKWCATQLNYQLVPAVLRWNYGETGEPPTIVPDLAGDPDPLQMAQRDQVLIASGAKLPSAWFYERHGIPEPEDGEETIGTPPSTQLPPTGGSSENQAAPGKPRDVGSPESGDPTGAGSETALNELAGTKTHAKASTPRAVNPPRSAVPSSDTLKDVHGSEFKVHGSEPKTENGEPITAGASSLPASRSSLPGDYQTPAATKRSLAEAHAKDFAPLRKAAEPLLTAIEAGNLDVVGELEAFIAHLDAMAPKMIGASALADSLEAALAEAAIAGAAGVYAKAKTKEPATTQSATP